MTAIALTIAGSDPSGGAGIAADIKTFSALGVYAAAAVTALTAQNTLGVQGVLDIPADFVARQLDSVFSDLKVDAVKIGMLSRPDIIGAVFGALVRHNAHNVVLDPVMVATSGDRLISDDAMVVLRHRLFPLAAIVTPNLPEAAALLDEPIAADEATMVTQARRLLAFGSGAVLLKGGHAAGPESVDILADIAGVERLTGRRYATRNTHGTGCTVSAAIAAGLAKGFELRRAVYEAKAYVTAAIEAANALRIGGGAGPVHHFHDVWR